MELKAPVRHVTISVAARLTGLTPRAIRFYEEKGLISSERREHGVRYYSQSEIDKLGVIALARQAGLSVREVYDLVALNQIAGSNAQRSRAAEQCLLKARQLESQARELERLAAELSEPEEPQAFRTVAR